MNTDKFLPAFPTWIQNDSMMPGMSLRDYFASAAMQGYMGYSHASMSIDEIAAWSYKVADALLKAREE
jgi:hypothetical protein